MNQKRADLRAAETSTELPTIKAALKYGDDLRAAAMRLTAEDVYAKPWYPTTHGIRKLVQRCTNQRRGDAIAAGLADDQVKQAELMGPSDAITYMAGKWINSITAHKEQTQLSERAQARHARRQRQAIRDREALLQNLSPGQRIDKAIAELSTVGAVKAQVLDPDKVHGTTTNPDADGMPKGPGDPAARAKHLAHQAVREIENERDNAVRRRVELDAA